DFLLHQERIIPISLMKDNLARGNLGLTTAKKANHSVYSEQL
ncbi:unnamed protein product, partial [marine sediment metagenome]